MWETREWGDAATLRELGEDTDSECIFFAVQYWDILSAFRRITKYGSVNLVFQIQPLDMTLM